MVDLVLKMCLFILVTLMAFSLSISFLEYFSNKNIWETKIISFIAKIGDFLFAFSIITALICSLCKLFIFMFY